MGHAPAVKPFEKKLIVITSPSGAGKTSIVKKLLQHFRNFAFSVSATTRDMRSGEVDGKDYYFVSPSAFQQKVAAGEFLEYEEVYEGVMYGTLKSEVERLWAQRKTVIFDIDIKGAANIKQQFGSDCFIIFVKPPSKDVLFERLKARNTENPKTLKMRLKRAEEELKFESKADYVVLNKDFDTAYMRTKNAIIRFLNPVPVYH
ncbi:MAG: guanylate kinase [Chitinophagales bacterium]|nr:guanylate kinase [Chitinophagales bacterium]